MILGYRRDHLRFLKNVFAHAFCNRFVVPSMDLLIVYGLEILPQYRGSEIGKYAIGDLYNIFTCGCGLMTTIIYPSQLKTRVTCIGENDYEWYNYMEYKTMEADDEKSMYKLTVTTIKIILVNRQKDPLIFLYLFLP